jgi:hypothetical protein
MMNETHMSPQTTLPRSRPLRAIILAMLIAFVAGLAAMGWALTHWLPMPKQDSTGQSDTASAVAAPPLGAPKTLLAPPTGSSLPPPHPVAPNVMPDTSPSPSIADARVAALETRLAEIDRHAAASADQASRAEGLLIAFAARRAIDSGVVLGYLEGELSNHFGASQPRAVANIIAASRAPVTLEGLRIGLERVSTETDPNSPKADWWTRFRANFGNLITVRRANETTTASDERLARARIAVTTGAVQNALAEVARLPGGTATNAWMADARRYIEAHNALDILEAAALTRPQVARPASPAPAQSSTPAAGPAAAVKPTPATTDKAVTSPTI